MYTIILYTVYVYACILMHNNTKHIYISIDNLVFSQPGLARRVANQQPAHLFRGLQVLCGHVRQGLKTSTSRVIAQGSCGRNTNPSYRKDSLWNGPVFVRDQLGSVFCGTRHPTLVELWVLEITCLKRSQVEHRKIAKHRKKLGRAKFHKKHLPQRMINKHQASNGPSQWTYVLLIVGKYGKDLSEAVVLFCLSHPAFLAQLKKSTLPTHPAINPTAQKTCCTLSMYL